MEEEEEEGKEEEEAEVVSKKKPLRYKNSWNPYSCISKT
jgi:hypothetical protein